jgi:hypothetical protein
MLPTYVLTSSWHACNCLHSNLEETLEVVNDRIGCYYMLSTAHVTRSLVVAVIMAYLHSIHHSPLPLRGEIVRLCYHHAKQLEQSYALASSVR